MKLALCLLVATCAVSMAAPRPGKPVEGQERDGRSGEKLPPRGLPHERPTGSPHPDPKPTGVSNHDHSRPTGVPDHDHSRKTGVPDHDHSRPTGVPDHDHSRPTGSRHPHHHRTTTPSDATP